jgi:hypothetical protein
VCYVLVRLFTQTKDGRVEYGAELFVFSESGVRLDLGLITASLIFIVRSEVVFSFNFFDMEKKYFKRYVRKYKWLAYVAI